MSGSLKRALAFWAASQVDGLHAYADDLANTKYSYPSCTLLELTHGVVPIGCGKKDYKVKSEANGFVTATGKMHIADDSFRLTVSSPSDGQMNGQEIVDGILETIESSILLLGLSSSPLILVDSEAVPPATYKLEKLVPAGRQAIPPDIKGEPFLYRGALTVKLTRSVPVDERVEHVIERIHVEGDEHVR